MSDASSDRRYGAGRRPMPDDTDPEAVSQLVAEIERLRAEIAALRTLDADFEIEGRVIPEESTGGLDQRRVVVLLETADGHWRAEQLERRVGEAGWWVRTSF